MYTVSKRDTELHSRFVIPPGGGDRVGSHELSPWEAILMEKTRNMRGPSKSKLASSEQDRE